MKTLRKTFAAVATLCASCLAFPDYAQNFLPPTGYSFNFNGSTMGTTPNIRQTHNYSIINIETMYGMTDMYLAGWSALATPGEVTYQFTAPGDPTNILYQNTIGVHGDEISVGSITVGTQPLILISYRSTGGSTSAYMLDIYKVTNGSPVVSFWGSLILSTNIGGDGRISMDCHKGYGVAVAYATPQGIETRVANSSTGSLVVGQSIPLAGTSGNLCPDVAISHAGSGPLSVHYVYYNPGNYRITESMMDFGTLLTAPSTPPIAPAIQDINQLPTTTNNFFRYIRPIIDCPDHYDVDNWAYAYCYTTSSNGGPNALPSDGIFVRHIDYHSAGIPTTVNLTDGSLGNVPCLDEYPVFPALYYGEGGNGFPTDQIYVAWYNQVNQAQDGGMFVGVHMREDGTGLFNDPDYYTIPNSYNSNSVNTFYPFNLYDYYIGPIALSKNSDAKYDMSPNFLYTTYFYRDPSYTFYLNHAFHKWNDNSVYRTTGNTSDVRPVCGPVTSVKQLGNEVQVQPNPFKDVIHVSLTLPEDGEVHTAVSDLLGRVVWAHIETLTKGDHTLQTDNLANIPAGIYMLNTSLNGKSIDARKVVKQ
ncbi:T9SS type A sorting domain-containing protein [Taibaiella soli]|uniref:Secretion system C-terminal sorting domain-containing protein n=1 Tax=Taibaiella soli TaxID=1649169 RepID=A0A2W2ANX5_9BACT|nr:T9SS type A sorting domain-containing protein [Taibaiella soli]PZF74070.1 hypothetical protein DN068_05095 [Taibaiella soli]